ncbi:MULTISPECIES: FHA domain-containing protein [unclassified Tolypothrix]|uniref:FHA domain-containing protein n=1 Tax=unclassified Tolypothrix TaxID=2649714 RepID=UPI0005EAAF83|nr:MULTISPECIES: FHA domain-containing protein [unclassified Tolypothrix]BAY95340.1 FHA domain containing protein [Microchaete diplosiphon NIES-3275]EKE96703.1 putative FHA domain protein [Tolypothrix sp. PCC 7601]MBE9084559.1 FHA domain-containing protein [Tolypothrix sp. LEGE 11397]UYD30559.1 FHA domain-containing protein [Tolypothrix sp. PCC 7712]UYD38310.1 FHA domain-containing protein [Tolypothrix sp. PCC 7601]
MISCAACGYDKNPDDAEYCDACGSALQASAAPSTLTSPIAPTLIQTPIIETTIPTPPIPQPTDPTSTPSFPTFPTTPTIAKLISKQAGSPVAEFSLDSNAVVGIFDPDMGPVDIDLEEFPGGETVSRNHAEIYTEGGLWKIKDLGSTNGVFIKRSGQTRFGARITMPETINFGDEIAFGKVRFLFKEN